MAQVSATNNFKGLLFLPAGAMEYSTSPLVLPYCNRMLKVFLLLKRLVLVLTKTACKCYFKNQPHGSTQKANQLHQQPVTAFNANTRLELLQRVKGGQELSILTGHNGQE